MIRNRVTNCWAAFGDDGEIVLPVAAFETKFKLDELPYAKITPALGRSLRTGNQLALSEIKRGMKAELFLTLNGTAGNGQAVNGPRKILSGWVQNEGMSDTSTMSGRWLGAEIGIIHKAGKLAGSPSVSYTFAAAHTANYLTTADGRKWNNSILRTENSTNSALFPLNRLMEDIFSRKNIDVGGVFPSAFLRAMIIAIVAGSEIVGEGGGGGVEGVFTAEEISDMVKDYDPANLSEFVEWLYGGFVISRAMLERYEAGWKQQNLWQAILNAAKMMFLSVVPYNEGFYIANPFGWLQTPNLALNSSEYTSLRQSAAMNVVEPVNGVVVTIPPILIKDTQQKGGGNYQIEWNFFYPPLMTPGDNPKPIYKSKGEQTGAQLKAGMYYHWRSLPSWLYPVVTEQFGYLNIDPNRKSRVQKDKPNVDLAKWADLVGTRAARMMYAQLLSEQAAASLIMPYREDIMPGTVVQIRTDTPANTSIVGDTLYGMVNNVKIYCSTVEANPVLQMEVQVTHLRGSDDNQEPPDGVALSEVPLYQNPWVGMNLFGELLADVPAGATPEKFPTKSYNSASGGNAPVTDPVAASLEENLLI